MELSTLPEHVVVETTEHKCLQSQFSVLYNEAMQLKTQLKEARNQLQVKFGYSEQATKFEKISLLKFDSTQILSGRFFQTLWPSQNIRTLRIKLLLELKLPRYVIMLQNKNIRSQFDGSIFQNALFH